MLAVNYCKALEEVAREKTPDVSEAEALKSIVERRRHAEETASAYREIERRTSPSLKQANKPDSFWGRVFGFMSTLAPGVRYYSCSSPLLPASSISPGR